MKRFYTELESLRGVAALWVVFYHAFSTIGHSPADLAHLSFNLIANIALTTFFGGEGMVVLFFVLSGFVLSESLSNSDLLKIRTIGGFALKRLTRLMPIAWAAIFFQIIFILVYYRSPVPWEKLPAALALNIEALQPFDGPLWSLRVEVAASLCFPILLFVNRYGTFAGRLLMLFVLCLVTKNVGNPYFVKWLVAFQCGIMIYDFRPLTDAITRTTAKVFLLFAVLLILLPQNLAEFGLLRSPNMILMQTMGATYLICFVLSGHGEKLTATLNIASLRWLGRISFSLYAFHIVLDSVAKWTIWGYVPPERYLPAQTLSALLSVILSVSTATVAYVLIERPSIKLAHIIAGRIMRSRSHLTSPSRSQDRATEMR